MHPPIGGRVSTDFKSLNGIKISRLVQILLYFYWFGAPTPQGGGGWVEWVSGGSGMIWGPSRQCGEDRDDGHDVGTTGTTCGDHGDHGDNMWRPRRLRRPQTLGTTWGPSGGYGDDVEMMGMMWGWWGQCGDHGDNEITKNAITFERIKIIEFHLKIWDPWTLLHTCRLQLMCRWGCPIPNGIFMQKVLRWPLKKIFSCFCTGSH